MDPSVPLANGRNMLEEPAPEILIEIFSHAICIELNEGGSKPVVTSKPLACFAHFRKKSSGAGLSVASKLSLAWQSPNAASCYLEALQRYVLNEQVTIYVNIEDLNFTNFRKLLTSLEKKQDALQLFSIDKKACSIKFSHRTTHGLRKDPQTFDQYCKKSKRLGITLNTEHKISEVKDSEALGQFVVARNGIRLDPQAPGVSQSEQIYLLFSRYNFRECTNPLANRPEMQGHIEALKESQKFENPRFQNTREGWARASEKHYREVMDEIENARVIES
ncbi:uncharacterized protein MYCFIDRAFT_82954 [Pseudocercospora fijiensis CIRAD86]|uniref:Uncharacterized protein n=1 Tax=Pseudocercospora fijiensis (strain CIRAD86) TaxID=383855 RepID=M3B6C7_PSEFD|nr:uncharacterized protein MYCFIDRAFT_82954 [Pseudocercospora fijiensis CIRAD86]EME84888.1 hypothetical protein MYCFIDRAFT_82954 [Pseudocercospora fijiensis CIRAD86]